MPNRDTLFIDLISAPPSWRDWLERSGIAYAGWEGQPTADQIKLTGCTNLPAELPAWIRRR